MAPARSLASTFRYGATCVARDQSCETQIATQNTLNGSSLCQEEYDDVFDPKYLGVALAERLSTVKSCLVPLTDVPDELQLMAAYGLASWVTSRFGVNLDSEALRDPKGQGPLARRRIG
jgi:hypothetical protein